jgi:dCTP diphosphatase
VSATLQSLADKVLAFRDERDWKQFHNPKDCALSMVLEATELLEIFQWKQPEELADVVQARKEDIAHELVDVLSWVLLMAHDLGIDLPRAMDDKMIANAQKYPAHKSRGTSRKYTEL